MALRSKYTAYDRLHENGPYGKALITTFRSTSRLKHCYVMKILGNLYLT